MGWRRNGGCDVVMCGRFDVQSEGPRQALGGANTRIKENVRPNKRSKRRRSAIGSSFVRVSRGKLVQASWRAPAPPLCRCM